MIKFIKKLLGIKTGCGCPNTPKETVAEILTPQIDTAKVSAYVEPVKPVASKKVKAISTPVPAKAKPVQKPAVTEGAKKGGNNVVKLQPKKNNKPQAPGKPKAKK